MQTFDTPMGSCISPLIADIYMEHIEHTAIIFHTTISLWLRYVDDTFCILNKDHIIEFQSHLNTICLHIQFTMEEEQNLSLPFLNILVTCYTCEEGNTTDNTLTTSTDIFNTHHITPNIKSSLLPKLNLTEWTHTSQTPNKSKVSNKIFAPPYDKTVFLPELLYAFQKSSLLARNTNTLLPFLTSKAHLKKLDGFWTSGG